MINCIMFYKIICFIIFFFGELLNTIYSELVNTPMEVLMVTRPTNDLSLSLSLSLSRCRLINLLQGHPASSDQSKQSFRPLHVRFL